MLKSVGIITGVLVVLIVIFIIWRWTSVARALLDPIAKRIDSGQSVSPQEIEAIAARPEIRFMLFAMLRELKRPDLLPTNYCSSVAQGESAFVHWMIHPYELQEAPQAIEFAETVKRAIDGQEADFHVFRYKMPAGHWAAKDGWLLGSAGPMKPTVEPHSEMPAAFSRGNDIDGKVKPSELVDWYIGILRQKGIDPMRRRANIWVQATPDCACALSLSQGSVAPAPAC